MSFSNRLTVAFDDLGDQIDLKSFKAFILLRQSCLTTEDKKKVLTMTGGKIETKAIDQAMRTLATKILSTPGEPKKIYPVNYVEKENSTLKPHGSPTTPMLRRNGMILSG